MDVDEASSACESLLSEIEGAVITDREFLETVLLGVVGRGHVLLEDVPGTGKTLTARMFAKSLGLSFSRIQFTPDLLPADVTGTHIFNEKDRTFEFSKGPIFANVVLADEINRAPPKTQSALLEAMEEEQVTVDGDTHELPDPFFVIATQNPVEMEGTFELPEAQVDRFAIKTAMGYPDEEGEFELLRRRAGRTEQVPVSRLDSEVAHEQMSQRGERPDRRIVLRRAGGLANSWRQPLVGDEQPHDVEQILPFGHRAVAFPPLQQPDDLPPAGARGKRCELADGDHAATPSPAPEPRTGCAGPVPVCALRRRA